MVRMIAILRMGCPMKESFHLSVKGIIFFGNEFLIVQKMLNHKHRLGFWELPGGGLGFGESPEDTLKREIFEETGLDAEVLSPIHVWSFLKTPQLQVVGITYQCSVSHKEVHLSGEHSAYQWIRKEDLPGINILPELLADMEKWDWPLLEKRILQKP